MLAAVFSTLGLTFVAAGSYVVRAARWLLGRAHKPAPPPPRTQHVLSGREDKAAALRAYLTERGVATDRAESELALAAHDAKKLAGEVLAVAGARGASWRYARALSKPTSSGTAELDAVYAALRAAGLPDAELRRLDVRLDETIIARHEPAAR